MCQLWTAYSLGQANTDIGVYSSRPGNVLVNLVCPVSIMARYEVCGGYDLVGARPFSAVAE